MTARPRRRAAGVLGVLAAAAALVVVAAGPSAAFAPPALASVTVRTLALGTPGHGFDIEGLQKELGLGLVVTPGPDRALTLGAQVCGTFPVPSAARSGGLGSIQWLGSGQALVCTGGAVTLSSSQTKTAAAKLVWTWSSDAETYLVAPCWAQQFTADGHAYVLIADPGARQVFAVDTADPTTPVWSCGAGDGASLSDPVCARYIAQGTGGGPTVLIADDGQAAPRVLEVTFQPGSEPALVWRYGGTPGTDPGELAGPTDVERESGGTTLIADAGGDRVIKVDDAGGDVTWQYGVSGQPGGAAGYLDDPMGASIEHDGDTVIADTGNDRIIVVRSSDYSADGGVTHGFTAASTVGTSTAISGLHDAAALSAGPRMAELVPSGVDGMGVVAGGDLIVCDRSGQQAELLGYGGTQAETKTIRLQLGSGDKQASLQWLRVEANAPRERRSCSTTVSMASTRATAWARGGATCAGTRARRSSSTSRFRPRTAWSCPR